MGEALDIAIIGMGCIFPGAPDLDRYWSNLQAGVDAITLAPADRWDPVFYDPGSTAIDRLYCRRGGFLPSPLPFDAPTFGVMPASVRTAEPDQLLALQVGTQALSDAGYADRAFPRDRTGVILGRGGYAGPGRIRLDQQIRTAEQLVVSLRSLMPSLTEPDLARIKAEFQAQVGALGTGDLIGLVPNLAASRLANRLDLHGPAFTVDAACASALVAVDRACADLSSGRCDMVLAGGSHLCQDESFWSVFCQLGAMSRDQQIRPFDRRADGLLIGEGIGMVVLKPRADAERDGDRVYAVIRGTGISSDGRETSLMTPRVEGQLLALERAWSQAGLEGTRAGMIEAHGTGTAAGDGAELETLRRFFGPDGGDVARASLGSVKSMIGHAMPAAGAAGLIKAALAVYHGALLPSLHCEEPSEAVEKTRFRVLAAREPWDSPGHSRVAGVSAFGFGGINAHVVLESGASASPPRRSRRAAAAFDDTRVALFAAESSAELVADLDRGREKSIGGRARLAVFDPDPDRLERARTIALKGRPWHGREGIWFSADGLISGGGKLAMLFPGVDAAFEPHIEDVAQKFGLPIPPHAHPASLEETGQGIVEVNRLLFQALTELGVRGHLLAGHSVGEWSAMIAGGMIPDSALEPFLASVSPGSLEVPGVVFAAAGCDTALANSCLAGLPEIAVSHDNCPHQIILCGIESSIDEALARVRVKGVLAQKLSFRSGFHSPLFSDYLGPHRENFRQLPLRPSEVPVWSATLCAPYPRDPEAIRALAVDHLVRPVRFRELTLRLYDEGVRVFVQVGTGTVSSFVEDTLRGRPFLSVSANAKDRSGLSQLQQLAAALFVEGVDLRLEVLFPKQTTKAPVALPLGVPLVKKAQALVLGSAPPSAGAHQGQLAQAFTSMMSEIATAQREVAEAFGGGLRPAAPIAAPAPPREEKEVAVDGRAIRKLSLQEFPELRDHAFFRQPPGWSNLTDLHLVVPLTFSLELLMEAAQKVHPGGIPIALEQVKAMRWLVVSNPVEVKVRTRILAADRVEVELEGYLQGQVVFGERYPDPPAADRAPLEAAVPTPVNPRQLYDDRWMFHGRAYQGVVEIGEMGADGIRGAIETGAAKGALLDNAGQLLGLWVMIQNDRDRMAMPIGIERLRLFGPHPKVGERLTCEVRIRRHTAREVRADLSLATGSENDSGSGSRVWAQIEGWEDRRFETDDLLWNVLQYPERNLLAVLQPEGVVLFEDIYRSAPTRDQLARRYLSEKERAEYEGIGPRRQRSWLAGRIAAKDAVRIWLWNHRQADHLFPIEIGISTDPSGRPRVRAAGVELYVSIAHKDELAVAAAGLRPELGVDVERIGPRAPGFVELAFHPPEVQMAGPEPMDLWLTRAWVAKECVAKARGTGLAGSPLNFRITDRSGETLLVEGGGEGQTRVRTVRRGDFVIGWTVADPDPAQRAATTPKPR